ncbi:serine hydrolase [Cupriavidus sp. 2TAF22]|uniref:serine hydrolase n=1 Tax=unclassified Cupriavidus TaxID=2640874 RepID=UPI003F915FE5
MHKMESPALRDFDSLVEASMNEWRVPGVAVAVIRDGEILLSKGYGVRDTDTGLPVTEDTQFLLCSLTKSFTAAGLGLLVDERRLDWAQPVRDIIPEFRLHDAVATERVTVRDLLSHHSGLPRHDWIHSPGDLSMAQILAALRHLEPSRDLRAAYQYQNLGYVVAGHIAERISGQRWEAFTTGRLLGPLGFAHFGLGIEALAAAPDHAHPHIRQGEESRRATLTPIRALAAGGLNASVSDLARWMRLLMNEGAIDGKPLLSADVVRQMMTPNVHAGRSVFSEVGDCHYGLGLTVEHYRGERKVSHTGSWVGWGTAMAMLPERRIGVAVLTNRDASSVPEILAYAAFDRLCGHQPVDWFGRFRAMRREVLAQQKVDRQARGELRRTGTAPSHALDDYVGEYEHPAYGRIGIASEGGKLAWCWRGMSGPLEHRHYDVFTVPDKPAEINPDCLALTFGYDREGVIDRITAPFEPMVADIVFRRKAAGDVLDPAFRALCAGRFLHGAQEIDVVLDAAGELTLRIATQQVRRLLPFDGRSFDIEGLAGYRVAFRSPSPGVVDALVFYQPDGTFLAPRPVMPA